MAKYMLSTIDNPYNPFTNFDDWLNFDEAKGYHSCAYLARILRDSDRLSEVERDEENERAINEILKYDPKGIYIRVREPKAN